LPDASRGPDGDLERSMAESWDKSLATFKALVEAEASVHV
jgi:hypothetical protein